MVFIISESRPFRTRCAPERERHTLTHEQCSIQKAYTPACMHRQHRQHIFIYLYFHPRAVFAHAAGIPFGAHLESALLWAGLPVPTLPCLNPPPRAVPPADCTESDDDGSIGWLLRVACAPINIRHKQRRLAWRLAELKCRSLSTCADDTHGVRRGKKNAPTCMHACYS